MMEGLDFTDPAGAVLGGYSEAVPASPRLTGGEPLNVQLTKGSLDSPGASARPTGGLPKRFMDILLSLTALLVLAPLLITIAVLIRLESKGPILFVQRRGGYRGRTFKIFKFRTMRTLEDGDVINQAVPGDPRVTRLGTILRKSSLDELPQLFNVLRGEMSLVGPRPHAVAHDLRFFSMDPNYPLRQIARPGITGLAQVSGSRGPLADARQVRRRVRLDTAYIAKWSFAMDTGILLRSVREIFVHGKAF
jgi:lipopolysaccharide/colanic/teichoic acid biosynthesis glycosyltransferase